ncbi:MAG: HAD family hydrolase [Candidatus Nomurabacteria bacterium]|nr:HAD family hydrolase [Candidatus Nomurabacteria bacterium]
MIKNIIFDWSGVVKDCILDYLVIANKIFKQFGAKEISVEELQEEWRQPYLVFYRKYLPNITVEEESTAYRKAILESPEARQYEGISDLIKKFKKSGIKLFIISSDDSDTLLPEIKNFDLENVFDEIVFGVHNKEEGAREIVEANNLNRSETIFIGDSNHEIEVGKKLGIKTGAVTWGFSSESRLKSENPDFLIHSLEELEKVILLK